MSRNELISAGIRLIGVYLFVQGILMIPSFCSVLLALIIGAFADRFSFGGFLQAFATGALISGFLILFHLAIGWYLMGGAQRLFARATSDAK